MDEFNGFPVDLFTFLTELSANNNRDWFTENKNRYQAVVVEPMISFIGAMAPRLEGVSPHFMADPRPNGGSMFRIHRDVRFSRDKRPYKEHVACQFRHAAGRDAHAPGFYVHLEPGRVMCGGGIWKPPTAALGRIRTAIDRHGEDWQAIMTAPNFVAMFGGIAGDGLVRPPKGFGADHPHLEDLKRKSFYAMRVDPQDTALSADFCDRVAATLAAVGPLNRFICQALDQPF